MAYSHAVLNAIKAFESELRSVLLVCVPSGNLAPERLDTFWETARHSKPDDRSNSAAFSHPSDLPLSVERQENGVILLLRMLHSVKLFKIIAVEGTIDFDMLGLLLAFDIRFCTRDAVFENRILDRGVAPGIGVLWCLARHLGQTDMVELVLNQRSINAEEALRLKLVSRLSDAGTLVNDATQFAKEVAAKPSAVLQALLGLRNFCRKISWRIFTNSAAALQSYRQVDRVSVFRISYDATFSPLNRGRAKWVIRVTMPRTVTVGCREGELP